MGFGAGWPVAERGESEAYGDPQRIALTWGPVPVSTPANDHPVSYSVVVPVFNEEGNVEALASRVIATMENLGAEFELLFVDDGSRDKTPALFRRLAADDPRVRVVRFTRNYGQEAAVEALYLNARRRWLIH